MEDLSIEYFKEIKFNSQNLEDSIKLMQTLLENHLDSAFDFLCILQNIRMEFSSTATRDNLVNAFVYFEDNTNFTKYIKFYDFFKKYFNLEKKTVSNYLTIAYKFLVQSFIPAGGNELRNIYKLKYTYKYKFDFCRNLTLSKMYELCSLSDEEIEKAFNNNLLIAKSTKVDIRAYVKQLKNGSNATKVLESNISEEDLLVTEDAFDPKKKYEFSYFESKTKNQLLNIIKDLLNYIDNLKTEKSKKRKSV